MDQTQDADLINFAWQGGYFAASVYFREVERLLGYIDRQEEHHRKVNFMDEYLALLEESGIAFDERYVWD